jgi:RimJ/RimL family protein N-acetyltransferase
MTSMQASSAPSVSTGTDSRVAEAERTRANRSTARGCPPHHLVVTLADWPLFGLELVTPRLVLRPPTDGDFPGLLAAIDAGIHDPATMPFLFPWTDAEPPARRRRAVQYWWSVRASWTADDWHLPFAVFLDGRAIGLQALMGTDFPRLRTVGSGSWLTLDAQGRGIGREMRAAMLAFAFETLGAEVAVSGAFTDNAASLAVSRALGYEPNGLHRHARRGQVAETIELRLTRARWEENRPDLDVAVRGFDACRSMFEATTPAP